MGEGDGPSPNLSETPPPPANWDVLRPSGDADLDGLAEPGLGLGGGDIDADPVLELVADPGLDPTVNYDAIKSTDMMRWLRQSR